ncbi:MAG: hypothetical protein HY791_11335 [Deltaproteobacteria bacterium]|nr:hypothetical protein [Deltaproteobacteria bacterium]
MPRVGDRVGSFTLLSPLPSGRRGERFLSSSSISRDLAVVEVLSVDTTSVPGFEAAFMSDAWIALSALPDQRTVLRVFERGLSGGSYYVATEWLPGASVDTVLSALCAKRQRMDVSLAIHIAIEIARALNAGHTFTEEGGQRRPVLHLRLRPEYVFLSVHGNVKLGGFGSPLERTVPSTSLAFAAPEILRGGVVDTRADIYALGSVLNLMLAGEDPLDYGRSLAPSIASVAPDLASIVRRAMDADAGSRWASTTALRTALQAWAKSARIDLANQTRLLPDLVKAVAPETPEAARPQTQWTQDDKTAVDPIDSSALRASLGEPSVAIAPSIVDTSYLPPSPRPRGASGGFSLEAAGQTSLDPVDPTLLRALRDPQVAEPMSAPPWMIPDSNPVFGTAPEPTADPLPLATPSRFPAQLAPGFNPPTPQPGAFVDGAPASSAFASAPSAFSGFDPNAPLSPVPAPVPAPARPSFGNGHETPIAFTSPAPRGPSFNRPAEEPKAPTPFASPAPRGPSFNRPAEDPSSPNPFASPLPRGPSLSRPPPIADPETPAFGTVIPPEARPPESQGRWSGDTQEGVVEAQTLRDSIAKPNAAAARSNPPTQEPSPQKGSSGWVDLLGAEAVGSKGTKAEDKIELANEKLELATSKRAREEARPKPQGEVKTRPRGASEARPPPKPKGESRVGVVLLAVMVIGAFFGIGLLLLGKL